jgi:hypothetical protein
MSNLVSDFADAIEDRFFVGLSKCLTRQKIAEFLQRQTVADVQCSILNTLKPCSSNTVTLLSVKIQFVWPVCAGQCDGQNVNALDVSVAFYDVCSADL